LMLDGREFTRRWEQQGQKGENALAGGSALV
jgi:hypothetical protein